MTTTTRGITTALALGLAATGLAGCTADIGARPPRVDTGPVRLVAFDSCDEAVKGLRAAARPYVGPYGFQFGGDERADTGLAAPEAAAGDSAKGAAPGRESAPEHSTTNTHEKGVDEPDLVKTDGGRVVTVIDGQLRVVDVASRKQTGVLQLSEDTKRGYGGHGIHLLMHGDRALVVLPTSYAHYDLPAEDAESPAGLPGVELVLVDLSGQPEVVSRMKLDGEYVDARAVGGTVRLVSRSSPRVPFDHPDDTMSPARAQRENQRILGASRIQDWLPRYEIDNGESVSRGQLGCDQVSHPTAYSGTSMLTVMTLHLDAALSARQAVSIVADGSIVYGTGQSLYVANDRRQVRPFEAGDPRQKPAEPRTEIYKFDTSGAGAPRHTGSGAVPGWLLNQYSMSEHEGHLRLATTTGDSWSGPVADDEPRRDRSQSAVFVLAHRGTRLSVVGTVGGLGKGEQIYSVRFLGSTGYVVTFRQTDPLYVVDLRNPRKPRVTGELKITGYSSYLHPAADGRLIGIGQEASKQGRRLGTQVSLFDVSDPAAPRRLAQHHVKFGSSEAEYDPHAFLYWPKTGLLVVPLTSYGATEASGQPDNGALVLKLSGDNFTELGAVTHQGEAYEGGMVRRSLIIDGDLWTVSATGLKVSDGETVTQQAWIPFA